MLTVTGSNFVSGTGTVPSVLLWDGTPVTPSVVNSGGTQITATIATTLLTTGVHTVTVQNASAVSTPALQFGVGLTVESLSPASVPVGSSGLTLTVNGTGFVQSGANASKIMWNGVALGTTTWVSATQLTAPFTTAQLSSVSTQSITVKNGSGAPSNGITFTVGAPTISAISPSSIGVGSASITLTVTGTNFVGGTGTGASTVMFGAAPLTTVEVNTAGTQITATVLASQLSSVGTTNVTVSNGGVVSTQTPTFTVGAPTVGSLSQTSADIGDTTPFTLTVTGTNFVSGTNASTVMWNGAALGTTTPIDATHISAQVTSAQLASATTATITVQNGSVVSTNSSTFTVNAAPTVTALSPTSATHGGAAFALTITGTGFVTGSTVNFGSGTTGLVPTAITSTSVTVTVPKPAFATKPTVDPLQVQVVLPTGAITATGTASNFNVK